MSLKLSSQAHINIFGENLSVLLLANYKLLSLSKSKGQNCFQTRKQWKNCNVSQRLLFALVFYNFPTCNCHHLRENDSSKPTGIITFSCNFLHIFKSPFTWCVEVRLIQTSFMIALFHKPVSVLCKDRYNVDIKESFLSCY